MATSPNLSVDNTAPGRGAAAITPSDGSDLAIIPTRGLWVGVGGNVRATLVDGTTVTIVGVQSGSLLPLMVTRVYSTLTTATDMLAVY